MGFTSGLTLDNKKGITKTHLKHLEMCLKGLLCPDPAAAATRGRLFYRLMDGQIICASDPALRQQRKRVRLVLGPAWPYGLATRVLHVWGG